VKKKPPALFQGPHFEEVIILLFVRWYPRYSLTYRDPEEIIAERNLSVDHVTIWRWLQLKVAGSWAYLYRAVDSEGETMSSVVADRRPIAAKLFLPLALCPCVSIPWKSRVCCPSHFG